MQADLFRLTGQLDVVEAVEPDPSLSQWFTPPWAADLLAEDALRGLGLVDTLEPSCGSGAFLGAIPRTHRALGVEIDPRMAAVARARTGREVIVGDYTTVDLGGRTFGCILGNPPFPATAIDALVRRAHQLLPDEGVLGLILPAHITGSAERIAQWREQFSIDVKLLPRSLFPRLTFPLPWARMIKSQQRTIVGLLLFDESQDISAMPQAARRGLQAGRTWREVIAEALASLGGQASLREIYAAVEPRRVSPNRHWRDKTRQVLAEYGCTFARVDETRWRLAA